MTRGADGFGRATRSLHWIMAAGILGTFALGAYIARMEVGLGNLWLFGLHKTLGISLLALAFARMTWHLLRPPPGPLPGPPLWEMRLARVTHRSLYALMLAVPVSGWAYASATGLDVLIFSGLKLPPIAPVSEVWEDGLHLVHRTLTWTLLALVALHVAGALKRALIARDGTLARMIFG
ncbi:MAG: cytochrome b [Paracoccaceae bacterium]